MPTIRVPYPSDPDRRRALFDRAVARLSRYGAYEGTPDDGIFRGTTPIGGFAGSYRSEPGSDVLVIELSQKPWLVPTSLVEHEVRKYMVMA